MRLIIQILALSLFAVLVSACGTTPASVQVGAGSDRFLVSGVYQAGANVTEPRPASSKFLKTYQAGFCVEGQEVSYDLIAEIVRPFDREVFMVAEFEDPLDPKKPVRYENTLDPASRSVHISHGPVRGLRMYGDYRIKVTVYESRDSTKVLDEFSQVIRSYVDTQTEEIKLLGRLKERS